MAMSSEERRQRLHRAIDRGKTSGARRKSADVSGVSGARNTYGADSTGDGRVSVSGNTVNTNIGRADASDNIDTRHAAVSDNPDILPAAELAAEKSGGQQAIKSDEARAYRRHAKSSGGRSNLRLKKNRPELPIGLIAGAAALVIAIIIAAAALAKHSAAKREESIAASESASVEASSIAASESESESIAEAEAELAAIADAELMAAQYDYDGAIEMLQSMSDYASNETAQEAVSRYEEIKSTLVEQDIYEITHVFFHILCVDPATSFDVSKWGTQAEGYNSLMTTIDEFEKMIQEMYDKGYVLVSLHDMAYEDTDENGNTVMKKGSIMLPPGKKAFVMSEDDVCYYEYMEGAGYADKMIVGDDGRPTLHYTAPDGTEDVGAYDLVGVLDEFIDEHPDFSYKGHKACLVFTGYNGVLGYRTDESYDPDSEYYDSSLEQGHDVEAERREAVEVMKALIADGYDLGSHSWGHRDLGQIEYDRFKTDCDRWDRNVATLIEEASGKKPDIIIYPKGADIADWHAYTSDNERFNYLYDLGFRYFCNVDSSQYWVQLGDNYLRQGRRALDGYNLWNDIANGYDRLSDLFDDVNAIFDPARPTPVQPY